MKSYSIIHLGPGNVGKSFIDIVYKAMPILKRKYGVNLAYCGCFSGNKSAFDENGLPYKFHLKTDGISPEEAIENISDTVILVDTTSSKDVADLYEIVLSTGGYVITSNKRPLAGSMEQYNRLVKKFPAQVYYEATICAGLPIVRPLEDLIDGGDNIIRIQGSFSSTIGFICTEMEKGSTYSEAIKSAMDAGITEPNPREDLAGTDVARKALLLGRMIGLKMELEDIPVSPLYDKSMEELPIEAFLKRLPEYDQQYGEGLKKAMARGNTYRYIAEITPHGVDVAIKEVPLDSPLGAVKGPVNSIMIQTGRYNEYPLVIQGPGAGVDVTAAGLYSDLLSVLF